MTLSLKRFAARCSAKNEIAFKREMVAARRAAGLSQDELAARLGVHRSTIIRWERLDSDPRLSDLLSYLAACESALELRVVPAAKLRPPSGDAPIELAS